MHLGIGPIVTGSIIMQLFTGAKIINLDLTDDEDKGTYQGTQKVLVIAMIFVEAVPQVFGYLTPSSSIVTSLGSASPGNGLLLANTIIIAQLVFGSYLVFLMDEVVSKWGIGSGISLFIAAGVSQQIVQGTLNWVPQNPVRGDLGRRTRPSGAIPKSALVPDPLQRLARWRAGAGSRCSYVSRTRSSLSSGPPRSSSSSPGPNRPASSCRSPTPKRGGLAAATRCG